MSSGKDMCRLIPVDDLCFSKDKFRGKEKFFMASDQRSEYLKISKNMYGLLTKLLPEIKDRNQQEAEMICLQLSDGTINLKQVGDILAKYNLLEIPTKEVKSKVVFDLNSRKLIEVPLEQVQSKHLKLFNWLYCLGKYFTYALLICAVANLIFNYSNFYEIFIINNGFSWSNLRISSFLMIFMISILGLIIHEMGHLFMATHCDIKWKSITVALIWGVSPVFYIRYKNLCIYPTMIKIKVLFAGIYMNIVQAALFYLLFVYTRNWLMAIGIFINLMLALNCFLPSGANDGYSIITMFLGIEGMFWKAFSLLQQIVKSPRMILKLLKNREGVISVAYIIVSYVLGVIGCVYLFQSVIQYLHIFQIDIDVVTFLILSFFIANTLFYIYKLMKKIRNE